MDGKSSGTASAVGLSSSPDHNILF